MQSRSDILVIHQPNGYSLSIARIAAASSRMEQLIAAAAMLRLTGNKIRNYRTAGNSPSTKDRPSITVWNPCRSWVHMGIDKLKNSWYGFHESSAAQQFISDYTGGWEQLMNAGVTGWRMNGDPQVFGRIVVYGSLSHSSLVLPVVASKQHFLVFPISIHPR